MSKTWSVSTGINITESSVCWFAFFFFFKEIVISQHSQPLAFSYCTYSVVLFLWKVYWLCVRMSVYLQYVCSQIMKYRHTKHPQTYYTDHTRLLIEKRPVSFFFFFSLVHITKQKNTTHIFIYQMYPVNFFKDGHIYIRQRPTYLKFPYSNIKTTVPQFTAAVK